MANKLQVGYVTPPENHRFVLLDGLRGVAALFVVAFHLPHNLGKYHPANGLLAVDFFFCLSGFVIAFSYEKRLATAMSFKDFLVRRWIRLYPVYIFGSAIGLTTVLFMAHFVEGGRWAWTPFLPFSLLGIFLWPANLSPFHSSYIFPLDTPSWSLFYEVIANIVFAILVKIRLARTTSFVVVAIFSAAILGYAITHGGTIDVGYMPWGFALGFARIGLSFSSGVLVYHTYRFISDRKSRVARGWLIPVVVTLSLSVLLGCPADWMHSELFRFGAVFICFPILVFAGACAHSPRAIDHLCVNLGEISYPVYLIHMPLVGVFSARHILRLTTAHPAAGELLVITVLAIFSVLSLVVSRKFDSPVRHWLTRLCFPAQQCALAIK